VNVIDDDARVVAPASSGVSLAQRVLRPRTIISFGIGIFILVFAVTRFNVDVAATLQVLRRADWPLVLLALAVYYTTFLVRSLRWRGMLENAGCQRAELPGVGGLAEIIYLSWFANSVVPAKLGDVYRAYLLRQRSTVSLSKGGGTIVAERLVDLAATLLLLSATGLLSFRGALPGTIVAVLEAGVVVLAVAAGALVLMPRLDRLVQRWLPVRFHRVYGHFQEGTLGAFGGYPQLISLTLLAWTIEAARLFLVTRAFNLTLSTSLGLDFLMIAFIALAAAFLTAPPGTPGGLGYVEASMVLVFTLLGATQPVALSVALVDRAISYGSLVVGGFLVYLISQRR
jgi:uncharacterized protein (TIRG00374 family)